HPLLLLSIWWEDLTLLDKEIKAQQQKKNLYKNRCHLIISAFPTPNGDLHLGHLAGPYIAADIYQRYQNMLGRRAYHLSGTLGNYTQVCTKAQKLGISMQAVTEKFSDAIFTTLQAANIYPKIFAIPNNNLYYDKICQQFFAK